MNDLQMNDLQMNDLQMKLDVLTLNNMSFDDFIDHKVTKRIYNSLQKNNGYTYPTTIDKWGIYLSNFIFCNIKPIDNRPQGITDGDYIFNIDAVIARLLTTGVLVEFEYQNTIMYNIGLNSVFKPRTKKRNITDYFEPAGKRTKLT